MHIVVVGGREKNEIDLVRIAESYGHSLERLDGDVAGRGIETIRHAVARGALVVILTEVNSHGGVHAAKREAQRFKKQTMVIDRLSSARLRGLLEALSVRARSQLPGTESEMWGARSRRTERLSTWQHE
jgi:predicted xylose isomerase-like sugar epimerase